MHDDFTTARRQRDDRQTTDVHGLAELRCTDNLLLSCMKQTALDRPRPSSLELSLVSK